MIHNDDGDHLVIHGSMT